MSRGNQRRLLLSGSFFIPVLVLLIYFFVKGITPFGDSSFLIHDMNAQYVDFYAYMRQVLQGKNNFVYSFSRGLGGDFGSFFAYYLVSPFNLIPILFPDELMPVGISLEMILLFGVSGLACCYSLTYFNEHLKPLSLLFFSAAYSLSGWMLLNAENFQFIPEAAVLPMVICSCSGIKREGKILPLIFWLTLSVILNFYIGYMVFIFAFLWVILPDGHKMDKKYFLAFLIPVVLSAPLWFSVLRQLGMTVKAYDPQWYVPALNFQIPDFLKKFLPGQFDKTQYMDDGLPAVYCGLFTLFTAAASFFFPVNKKRSLHRGALLLILFVSLIFQPASMIWQGFSRPRWWPYRFSFILIYLIVLCAAESRKQVPWFLFPLAMAGLVYNLDVTFSVKLENMVPLSAYSSAVTSKRAVLDSINDHDGVYRIEDKAPRSDNDAMHFAYAGITHFDSLANRDVFRFLEGTGFPRNRYTLRYGLGNTEFVNALLGVRYVLDRGVVYGKRPDVSLAFFVASGTNAIFPEVHEPVAFQNALSHDLGSEKPVLKAIEPETVEKDNLECDDVFCWIPDMGKPASFSFGLSVPGNGALYADVDGSFLVGDLFFINEDGEKIPFSAPDGLIPLCQTDGEGNVIVSVTVDSPVTDYPNVHFYWEDSALVTELFDELTEGISIRKISSSALSIVKENPSSSGMLVVTVPYDQRWHAVSGGKALETGKFWDTFLAVSIPENVSEIRLEYR